MKALCLRSVWKNALVFRPLLAVNKRWPLVSNVGLLERHKRHCVFYRPFHVTKVIGEEVKGHVTAKKVVKDKPQLDINFFVRHDEDDISLFVELGSQFHRDYDRCVDLDEIVVPAEIISDENKSVTLWLDFVMDEEHSFQIYPEDPYKGFTLGELLTTIKSLSDKVYAGRLDNLLDDCALHTISYHYDKNEIWLDVEYV